MSASPRRNRRFASSRVIVRHARPLGRHLSASTRIAQEPQRRVLAQLVAQEVHRVAVLREHHHLLVAALACCADGVLQRHEFAVGRAAPGLFEQECDLPALFECERFALELAQLLGVRGPRPRSRRPARPLRACSRRAACRCVIDSEVTFERCAKRTDAACEAAPVGGHHESDRCLFGRFCLVVALADVCLDGLVEIALGHRHLDELVSHVALRDRGIEHSRFGVAPQELSRVARDQVPNRCVRPHDRDRGPSFVGLHAASRDAGRVAHRSHDPVHLQLPELGEPDRGV